MTTPRPASSVRAPAADPCLRPRDVTQPSHQEDYESSSESELGDEDRAFAEELGLPTGDEDATESEPSGGEPGQAVGTTEAAATPDAPAAWITAGAGEVSAEPVRGSGRATVATGDNAGDRPPGPEEEEERDEGKRGREREEEREEEDGGRGGCEDDAVSSHEDEVARDREAITATSTTCGPHAGVPEGDRDGPPGVSEGGDHSGDAPVTAPEAPPEAPFGDASSAGEEGGSGNGSGSWPEAAEGTAGDEDGSLNARGDGDRDRRRAAEREPGSGDDPAGTPRSAGPSPLSSSSEDGSLEWSASCSDRGGEGTRPRAETPASASGEAEPSDNRSRGDRRDRGAAGFLPVAAATTAGRRQLLPADESSEGDSSSREDSSVSDGEVGHRPVRC